VVKERPELRRSARKRTFSFRPFAVVSFLSQEGNWAVLTRDLRIRSRPHERAAMDASKIVYFFLSRAWKDYNTSETAVRLIRLMEKISAQVELAERGRFELPINAGSKLRPYRD
jgi:hypothetical protein